MFDIANTNSHNELAKILWYYNLIPDTNSLTQKIICPFHADVNPSMVVNLHDDSWFCFGCNLSGNAVMFVKLMEAKYNDLNDLQSYQKYLQILKSNKVSNIKVNKSQTKQKALSIDLYNQAYDYYYGLRKVNWKVPDNDEEQNAKSYMIARGFDSKVLCNCGAKVTYSHNYGLIFPMLDNNDFKGWVCRTMIKSIESKRKYLFNEGFSRATTLVGDYGTKDYIFIVEGYMDRLKFIQYGINDVVAILGWKISQQQIDKLKNAGIKYVISALDNDVCGKKGTEYLKNYFDVIRFSYLKDIKDPGDMTQDKFKKMLRRTMDKLEKFKSEVL